MENLRREEVFTWLYSTPLRTVLDPCKTIAWLVDIIVVSYQCMYRVLFIYTYSGLLTLSCWQLKLLLRHILLVSVVHIMLVIDCSAAGCWPACCCGTWVTLNVGSIVSIATSLSLKVVLYKLHFLGLRSFGQTPLMYLLSIYERRT